MNAAIDGRYDTPCRPSIDASYQGDGGGHHGGEGDPGGGPPDIDLDGSPRSIAMESAGTPAADRVVSLYTSMPTYTDAYSNDESCRGQSNCSWPTWGDQEGVCESCDITWFPGWSQQRAFDFDCALGAEAVQAEDRSYLEGRDGSQLV